jgi:hypothetical protein
MSGKRVTYRGLSGQTATPPQARERMPWVCPFCGVMNPGKRRKCQGCKRRPLPAWKRRENLRTALDEGSKP